MNNTSFHERALIGTASIKMYAGKESLLSLVYARNWSLAKDGARFVVCLPYTVLIRTNNAAY